MTIWAASARSASSTYDVGESKPDSSHILIVNGKGVSASIGSTGSRFSKLQKQTAALPRGFPTTAKESMYQPAGKHISKKTAMCWVDRLVGNLQTFIWKAVIWISRRTVRRTFRVKLIHKAEVASQTIDIDQSFAYCPNSSPDISGTDPLTKLSARTEFAGKRFALLGETETRHSLPLRHNLRLLERLVLNYSAFADPTKRFQIS